VVVHPGRERTAQSNRSSLGKSLSCFGSDLHK
jgi:hypothetical protein